MRHIFFFLIVLSVLIGLVGYTTARGINYLGWIGPYKHIYTALVVVLLGALLTGFIWVETMPLPWAKVISFVGYSYIIVLVYLMMAFVLFDLVLLVNSFTQFIHNIPLVKFIVFTIVSISVIVSMLVGYQNFNKPKIVNLKLESNKPKIGKSIKIVAVSDLHLGVNIHKSHAQKYVVLINDQNPDLVLIAGDLVDRSVKPVVKQHIQDDLRQINAPMGVFTVMGNHEYIGNHVGEMEAFLKTADIKLLRDETVLINDEIYIVGRDDKTNKHRVSISDLIEPIDSSKSMIVLDHQPFNLDETAENKVDLQFSGHTHNGQFFPINCFVKLIYENGYAYTKKADTHFYVSSGLGIWGPQYRIGTQSELVIIDYNY